MGATKKQKVRLEKTERLVLPNVFRRFCPQCRFEQFFVSTEQATFFTNLTTRQIFRLVEAGAIHFFETEEGFLYICADTLKISSRPQLILEEKEKKQVTK